MSECSTGEASQGKETWTHRTIRGKPREPVAVASMTESTGRGRAGWCHMSPELEEDAEGESQDLPIGASGGSAAGGAEPSQLERRFGWGWCCG
jgi:hypothetical protein